MKIHNTLYMLRKCMDGGDFDIKLRKALAIHYGLDKFEEDKRGVTNDK